MPYSLWSPWRRKVELFGMPFWIDRCGWRSSMPPCWAACLLFSGDNLDILHVGCPFPTGFDEYHSCCLTSAPVRWDRVTSQPVPDRAGPRRSTSGGVPRQPAGGGGCGGGAARCGCLRTRLRDWLAALPSNNSRRWRFHVTQSAHQRGWVQFLNLKKRNIKIFGVPS